MLAIKRPCSNCKRRRIRCDRQVPQCKGCSQSKLQCEYPPPTKATVRSKEFKEWNQSYKVFKINSSNADNEAKGLINQINDNKGSNSSKGKSYPKPIRPLNNFNQNGGGNNSSSSIEYQHQIIKSPISDQLSLTLEKLRQFYIKKFNSNNNITLNNNIKLTPLILNNPSKLIKLALEPLGKELPVWGYSIFKNQFTLITVEVMIESDNNNIGSYISEIKERNKLVNINNTKSNNLAGSSEDIIWNSTFNQITFKLQLIDLYFTYSNPFTPLLSKSKFFENLNNCSIYLMSAVCFAGYQHYTNYNPKFWNFLLNENLKLIESNKLVVKLDLIQACLLICRSILHWGKIKEGWKLLSQAIRLANLLGLYKFLNVDNCRSIEDYERCLTWNLCIRVQYAFLTSQKRPPITEFPYYSIPNELLTNESCYDYLSLPVENCLKRLSTKFELIFNRQVTKNDLLEAQMVLICYKIEMNYFHPIKDDIIILTKRSNNKELKDQDLEYEQSQLLLKLSRLHLIVIHYFDFFFKLNFNLERVKLFFGNYLIQYYSTVNSVVGLFIPTGSSGGLNGASNNNHSKNLILTLSKLLQVIESLPSQLIDYRYFILFITLLNCIKNQDKLNSSEKLNLIGLFKSVRTLFDDIKFKFLPMGLNWRILEKSLNA